MPIKGMRDIKTHGTLSCEGKLLSVARDWRRIDRGKINSVDMGAWDGSVARNVFYKKSAKPRLLNIVPFYQAGETMQELLRTAENDIEEMTRFVAEGLPGAKEELERLRQKLSRIRRWR